MNKQISINSKLFFSVDSKNSPLTPPLHHVKKVFGNVVSSSSSPVSQSAYKAFLDACIYYCLETMYAADPQKPHFSLRPTHLAIGRNSSAGGGEETFVEFEKNGSMRIAKYDPTSGNIKVSIKQVTGLSMYYLEAPAGQESDDGEIVWLALLPTLLADPSFATFFAEFKQFVEDVDVMYVATGTEPYDINDRFERIALTLCRRLKELFFEELHLVKLLIPEKDNQGFQGLRAGDITSGKIGPSMSKIVLGNFQYFKPSGSGSAAANKKSYTKEEVKKDICSKMRWVNPCNTPTEKSLIPENDGIVTPQIVDMVTELVETQDNPLATRKRFFLIEGPAGVGKSFNARMFAELNERPFVVQTLSPTDQKEDLIGGIVPITKDSADDVAAVIDLTDEEKAVLKAINESDEESTYENVAAALGFPSYDLCRMDPEGSWESITGETLEPGKTVSITSVIALVNRKVLSAVVSINNKCKDNEAKLKNAKEQKIIEHLKVVRSRSLMLLMQASLADDKTIYDSCKEEYDEIISDKKVCCYPPLDFFTLLSLFSKCPEMTMPYIPGYNGNREDFLPRYEKETEVEYKFVPSPFVRAFQNGWVCELQEATCLLNPSALSGLHDALEPESMGVIITPYGEIRRHPDFVCIATQNRKYPGTKPLNPATRSRFQYFDCPDALSKSTVMTRIAEKCDIKDKALLKDIAEVFKNLESCARSERLSGEMTMRAAFNFADALKRGKDKEFARDHYALWAVSTEEDDVITLKNSISDCQGMA